MQNVSVETYFCELRDIRATGAATPETSFYPALSNLLNAVGAILTPPVRCVMTVKNQGGGLPDGGFFTAAQFEKNDERAAFLSTLPERGVLEVKGADADIASVARSEQVARYLGQYGQVLVTNLRQFSLVMRDAEGKTILLERYDLATDERTFWRSTHDPASFAREHAEPFAEYLKRALLATAALEDPQAVAWFLASYARDAKSRLERADPSEPDPIRTALEEALSVRFEGEKGARFFRSTLVQTLFYGVFSAWVLWHKRTAAASAKFDWRTAAFYLRVPILRKLFHQVAEPGQLERLGLIEVLDWSAAAINRVRRDAFFAHFNEGEAVQYFYEPFLQAFDPELRKELGVWYTPPEIVRYMVARVDAVLRTELNLPDGLADPNVYVLDPCCGTGAYLVETLRRIHQTFEEKGEAGLAPAETLRAATQRVFGFEILPAPFVVAHLQLGLLLQNLGAAFGDRDRAGVYLTNALTGWEPPTGSKKRFLFPELEDERDAAEAVKRDKPILVVLGNPPYNAFAGVSPQPEGGLVEPYKEGLISQWGIKKFNLDDLYVRFFRVAERRIAERSRRGVVCYISNFSYLEDPSFVVMRRRFLSEFDAIWIDRLNGDSRETGKRTPDGKPDPSVFSTELNREGIRVGTAVALLLRAPDRRPQPVVNFRQFWGKTKRADILASLDAKNFDAQYECVTPSEASRFSFIPMRTPARYLTWPKVTELCAIPPCNGPIERRGNSLIVFENEKESLARLRAYLDPKQTNEEVFHIEPRFMKASGEFHPEKTRAGLLARNVRYDFKNVVRYPFKPFDVRRAYLDPSLQPLFSRPSPELLSLRDVPQNAFFITRDTADKSPEGAPFYFSPLVCDYDFISGHARHFPMRIRVKRGRRNAHGQRGIFDDDAHETFSANLSPFVREYLARMGVPEPDEHEESASLIWMHALAIGFSPRYLSENSDGVRCDWPRIPLPQSRDALFDSAALGRQIAALLDTETPIPGVTTGVIRPELKSIAVFVAFDGTSPNREGGGFDVTAGWGRPGKDGATMPGKGRLLKRDYVASERAAILHGAENLDMSVAQVIESLGSETFDIFANERVGWRNVPARTWEFVIGGYQPMKKWLSYRESAALGRGLTTDEIREASFMARRIAALRLLEPRLDVNYAKAVQ